MIGKKLFMIGGTAMFFNPKKHRLRAIPLFSFVLLKRVGEKVAKPFEQQQKRKRGVKGLKKAWKAMVADYHDQELWEHYFKPWAYIQAKSIRHPKKAKSYVLSPNNYCNSNNIKLNDRKLNPHPS
jgi:hypothetical protein